MPDYLKNNTAKDLENIPEKFSNFVHAFGATRLLLQKAHKGGFLLEGLVLYASLTDGLCRNCLVLKEQLERKNKEINLEYIYQKDNGSYYTETKIYELVLDKKIVDNNLFDEINKLYKIRNKAIHRFFISEIEYSHLEIVLNRYEIVYNKLHDILYNLETEQIENNVGITVSRKGTAEDEINAHRNIYKKIKSGNERNLAKTLDCNSVEEIVEFASNNGLLIKCVCGHEKIHHIDKGSFRNKVSRKINDYLAGCSMNGCRCSKYKKHSSK